MKTLSKPNHKAVRKVINKEMGKELKMRFLCESIHLIEYEQQTVSHQSTHTPKKSARGGIGAKFN